MLVCTHNHTYISIYAHIKVFMSLPTLRIRLGLWKWVQLYLWLKTNKQMAGHGVSISRGINWWKVSAAYGFCSWRRFLPLWLVSWSPNWSQSSKDHPTQYQLDSKQKCDQTSSMPDRRQNPIPEHSPQGSQGVIPAYLSALHLLFTQPCNTPASWNTFFHWQQGLHFFLSLENSSLKA